LIVLPPGVDGDIVKLRVENAKLTTQGIRLNPRS